MTGHIRRRAKKWAIVVELGRTAAGKRQQRWHSGYHRRKDAERDLPRILREMQTGTYVDPTKLTVGEYLEHWLDAFAKHNVAPKTYEGYAEFIQLYISPAIGHLPLTKLQPLHLQSYYSEMLRSGRRRGEGGLSAQTVLHHHRVIRQALQQAVRWQILARNPADAVEPPKPPAREMTALSEEHTAALLSVAKATRQHLPILLAVSTGLRRGEVLGLRWDDVDLEQGSLTVRQCLQRTRGGLSFVPPKTQRSRRTVALPAFAVERLVQYRGEQAEEILRLGPAYQDDDLVIAREDGSPWSPDAFSKAFRALARKADLPRMTFHCLRHTHASQLCKAGVHVKVISERLGHSTVGITLDLYSHLLPGMDEDAAQRIDTALGAAIR